MGVLRLSGGELCWLSMEIRGSSTLGPESYAGWNAGPTTERTGLSTFAAFLLVITFGVGASGSARSLEIP